jgi:predicted glycoside hydrolase/deacetylase ChbG (UPF0249 family)
MQGQGKSYLITTADDFGLTEEINAGILQAHTTGILRSTALLMNGLALDDALHLARRMPDLEVGIHLGLVEGRSLRGRPGTTTDELRYFGGDLCLHRDWPAFVRRFVTGRIDLAEVEEELDLQLQRFVSELGPIPFANGTQHLHLLPGVLEVVVKLARRYQIPYLRLPRRSMTLPGLGRRRAVNMALMTLGGRAARRAEAAGIGYPRHFAGFDICGHLDAPALGRLLGDLPPGTTELMCHPGLDCPYLRDNLPWAYSDFHWPSELAALTDPGVREVVKRRAIELIHFKDLGTIT